MKIHAVGTELFHAVGRTDKTKLTVDFRNLVNGPKNFQEDGATATAAGGCASCATAKVINLQPIE
jgi:hypothetical protein